ncbi:MAG TPA: DUF1302 family protein, partial [Polyangiales bacterium]
SGAEESRSGADAVGWDSGPVAPAAAGTVQAAEETASAPPVEENKFKIHARARMRAGLWTKRLDVQPLAQARASLDVNGSYATDGRVAGMPASFRLKAGLHTDYDAAYLVHRDLYDRPTLDAYRSRTYMRETLLGGTIGALSLTFGRQVITLGQGEVLGLVDVLNARDLREPGLTEPEDLRLPVLTTRVGLRLGKLSVEGFVVHESNYGFFPPPMGTLSPFNRLISENELVGTALGERGVSLRHEPRGFSPELWQYLARASYWWAGLDMEFYGGSVLDRLGVTALPPAEAFAGDAVSILLYHPRYTLLATSGSLAIDNFLVRYELAAELDRPLATMVRREANLLDFGYVRRSLVGAMLGVTYFGNVGTNAGIELQRETLLSSAPQASSGQTLLWPVENLTLALRLSQDLARETLQLRVLAMVMGFAPFNGAFARVDLAYTLLDGLKAELGYIAYFSSEHFGPFYGFDRHDRAQFTVTWDFNVR